MRYTFIKQHDATDCAEAIHDKKVSFVTHSSKYGGMWLCSKLLSKCLKGGRSWQIYCFFVEKLLKNYYLKRYGKRIVNELNLWR